MELTDQEVFRRKAKEELETMGINPYPAPTFDVNATTREIHEKYPQDNSLFQEVRIAGRIMSRRVMGAASFAELQDETGRIQLYVKRDEICPGEDKTLYNTIFKKLTDIGDIVGVTGFVFTTQMGETSIHVKSFTMLSKSLRPLPIVKEKDGQTFDADIVEEEDLREQPYKQCLQISSPITSDEFISGAHDAAILRRISAIVESEAPISKSLLARRLIVSYGITRMGARLTPYFDKLLHQAGYTQTGSGDAIFIWAPGQNPQEYDTYRPSSSREPLDIAPEEISAAIVRILDDQGSLPMDALRREVAQLFGYSRLGDNVTAAVNRALDYAQSCRRITIENDRARKA